MSFHCSPSIWPYRYLYRLLSSCRRRRFFWLSLSYCRTVAAFPALAVLAVQLLSERFRPSPSVSLSSLCPCPSSCGPLQHFLTSISSFRLLTVGIGIAPRSLLFGHRVDRCLSGRHNPAAPAALRPFRLSSFYPVTLSAIRPLQLLSGHFGSSDSCSSTLDT